jgi:hypothetical protein
MLKKVNGMSTCGSPMPLTNRSAFTEDHLTCLQEYVRLLASTTTRLLKR